jgi:arylsulfatase
MGWGAGAGLLVGLLAPPLLGSIVVGAAAGALIGRFTQHRVASGIHDKIGENLPPGSAAVITVFDDEHRLAVERALSASPMRSVAQTDKQGLAALKEELATAMGKFSPDRTVLPIPGRTFGGTMGRTIDHSAPDWSMMPGARAPEGAPNVLITLIDDAGFGGLSTFGGGIDTPTLTRVQELGLTYNRFHVTAVCSPTRAALLTGRNHHRVGFGSIAEYPGPYPAGPFDHWPQSWGFDHWWEFLSGAAGQYDPIITQDNSPLGLPRAGTGRPTTSPATSRTRPRSGCTPSVHRTRPGHGNPTSSRS